MSQATKPPPWWGHFSFEINQINRWQIGPLALWIRRTEAEWHLASSGRAEQDDEVIQVETNIDDMPDHYTRYAYNTSPESIELQPVLADRAFVVKMERPFNLAPKNKIYIHISSPLWLRLRTTQSKHTTTLTEYPIHLPSDTWFGANTREGEMCYAAKTYARLDLRNLYRQPYRVFTNVGIYNESEEILPIERMRIPLRNLSLYVDSGGTFWTQPVRLTIEDSAELAKLRIEPQNLFVQDKLELISTARDKSSSPVVRAFSSLLSAEKWR